MLLDRYSVEVSLPQDGHFLDEALDQEVAKLADLEDVIRGSVGNWVKERIPNATVEVR